MVRERRCDRVVEAVGTRGIACEKKFGKCAYASASITRIRSESSESAASDSRPASLAMTFWRRCGEAATTFFRKLDAPRTDGIGRTKLVDASLLPRHRGASPIQAAILAGDATTGVTIQRIVKALDEGDVLLAKERAIGADETAGELLAALAQLGGEAAVEALDSLESGRAKFTPQDASRATYARKFTKEHGAIDWSKSAAELARFVRAMNPWPGATSVDSKQRAFTLLAAREVATSARAEPGVVLEAQARFVVACGGGALELVTLVPAGKRAMSGEEFLRGARLAAGERLGTRRES